MKRVDNLLLKARMSRRDGLQVGPGTMFHEGGRWLVHTFLYNPKKKGCKPIDFEADTKEEALSKIDELLAAHPTLSGEEDAPFFVIDLDERSTS